MSFDSLLNKTATIKRQVTSKDRYNNNEISYTTHASNIKVRLDSSSTIEDEDRSNAVLDNGRVFTRYSDIKNTDIIEIDNLNYQVIGDPIGKSNYSNTHHYEINVKLVTL